MKKSITKLSILFGGYVVCLMLCLWFKKLIIAGIINLPQNNLVDFYILKNTGAAFSLFKGSNLILAIFAVGLTLAIFFNVIKNIKKVSNLDLSALIFLLAGISSNMLERLLDSGVTDYIRLKFINFPVFNSADILINIGVFLLILSILTTKKETNE